MPSPFYDGIKGTTGSAPGTGAFTPNGAASGFLPWSGNVPNKWIGIVCYEDGSNREWSWGYWDGTSISRSSTQFINSTTGSPLSLSSSATATLAGASSEIQPHFGTQKIFLLTANGASNTFSQLGSAPTLGGTASAGAPATTNLLTSLPRLILTSATTANAQSYVTWMNTVPAALASSTAGMGGYEITSRWGCTSIPTGPRMFVGVTNTTYVGTTGETSALTAHYAGFGLDSTDTNIQLLTNSNVGSGTKIDTGIPLVVNGVYETAVWSEPGSTKVYGLLIRLDTGAIWFGSTTTDVPASGTLMFPQAIWSLNGTNIGTAFVPNIVSLCERLGP